MNIKTKNNKKIEDTCKIITDFKECYEKDIINIYPFFKDSKKPVSNRKEKLTHDIYFNKKYDIDNFRFNNNLGVMAGYKGENNKEKPNIRHIAFLDIDGYKPMPIINDEIAIKSKYWYDEETHIKVCEYLFNILKQLDIEFIPVKTWSKGYHLIFFTEDDFLTSDFEILNSLHYPKDFFIKELQGKPLNIKGKAPKELKTDTLESLEIIGKTGKVFMFNGSTIKDTFLNEKGENETRNGKYEIITTENKTTYELKRLYENPVSKKELETKIKELFLQNGFEYKEPVKEDQIAIKSINYNDDKKHYESEIIFNAEDQEEIIKNLSEILKNTQGNHNNILQYLTSGLEYNKLNSSLIYFLLSEALKRINDNTKEHLTQIKSTLENQRTDKKGFKSLKEEYPQLKGELYKIFDILNKYIITYNSIFHFLGGYGQQNKKIYHYTKYEDQVKKHYKGNFSIHELIRYKDLLGISEAKYTLTYYDGFDNEIKTLNKYAFNDLVNKLYNDGLFNTDKREAERILKNIIHGLEEKKQLIKECTILHKGFFIDNDNKLISNTNIDNLKTSDEELKEAIYLLIDLLNENTYTRQNNAYVLRKCLSMPFNYCIKQLGYAEDNTNGLILYGRAKTGKTTILLIGLWFYLEEPYNYNASTDTLAGLQTVLNNTTFYSVFDDSYSLLKQDQVQNTLKKGMYEKYSRSVYDINNTDSLKEYKALSTPVFSYNENIIFNDDGIKRRFDKIFYNSKMVMSKEESTAFKMEYQPFNKDSVLYKLHHIGIAYKDFIKPYLEKNNPLLNDMDQLTINFFRETFKRLGINEYLPLLDPYEAINDNGNNITINLRDSFNSKLLNNKQLYNKTSYNENDFIAIANSGYFNWLKYQPRKEQFIIDMDLFTKECNKIINQSLSNDDILKELKLYYELEYIKVNNENIRAIRITFEDLLTKIFNITINEEDFIDYGY